MNEKPTQLDLFSGIGGFALAAQWAGFRTIGFCEIDKYCQKILAKNFLAQPYSARGRGEDRNALHEGRPASESGGKSVSENTERQNGSAKCDDRTTGKDDLAENFLADAEESRRKQPSDQADASAINGQGRNGLVGCSPSIHANIFDLDGRQFKGVSLITGGFPCQPFSVAGKRRGAADDRAIWPEMFRVIEQARPAWILGENVPGIIPMELDNVLSDLEGIGYATRAFAIPACAVDARHRRDRLWIIGRRVDSNSDEQGLEGVAQAGNTCGSWQERAEQPAGLHRKQNLPNTEHQQLNGCGRTRGWRTESPDCCRWQPEPDVCRVAHGIPKRVDRLKGLGNAIVPQVAYEILREIRKLI